MLTLPWSRVPPVGAIVMFEGHLHQIVSHKRGMTQMVPVDREKSTFKSVACTTKDLERIKNKHVYAQRLSQQGAAYVNSTKRNTAKQADMKDYCDHVTQLLLDRFGNTENVYSLPRRHLIKPRHWEQQKDK